MKLPAFIFTALPVLLATASVADEDKYWKIGDNVKCTLDGTHLFRTWNSENPTLEECYQKCYDLPTCQQFSYGPYAGTNGCMGCNITKPLQEHNGFTTYELKPQKFDYALTDYNRKCTDGSFILKAITTSRNECSNLCKDTAGCEIFTYGDHAPPPFNDNCLLCSSRQDTRAFKGLNMYSLPGFQENLDQHLDQPKCGDVWGDPHIITFDNVRYDCQGEGEFVLAKSKSNDNPLEIHGRFTKINGNSGWEPSVTRSIAIKVDEDVPPFHVTIPDSPNEVGECPYSYTLGADEAPIDADEIVSYFQQNYEGQANIYPYQNNLVVTFPDYNARIVLVTTSHTASRLGCYMRVNICLTPSNHGGADNIVGMLGSPDGVASNEWMDEDGAPLPLPDSILDRRRQGHDYCMENWCVGDSGDSLYGLDTFNQHNGCLRDDFDSDAFIDMVQDIDQEVIADCEQNTGNPEECAIDVAIELDDTDQDYQDVIANIAEEESLMIEVQHLTEEDLEKICVLWGHPTAAPTNSTPSSTGNDLVTEVTPAGSHGDPHFNTWKQEHFEYHGQCDMVLTKDIDFADGLGLEVQIRTKLVRFWSYIKTLAIRIGDDILELEGNTDSEPGLIRYWYNFEYNGKIETLGGFPVKLTKRSSKKSFVVIDLSSKYPNQKIAINTWNEFVKIDFQNGTEESFGNTVGLLGNFKTGETLARDGATVMDDFSEFGIEWQVLPSEDMLFHTVEQPQFPKRCIEPEDPRGERRRRLKEESVSEAQAEKACSFIRDQLDRKDCVYDILATQDLAMTGAY